MIALARSRGEASTSWCEPSSCTVDGSDQAVFADDVAIGRRRGEASTVRNDDGDPSSSRGGCGGGGGGANEVAMVRKNTNKKFGLLISPVGRLFRVVEIFLLNSHQKRYFTKIGKVHFLC